MRMAKPRLGKLELKVMDLFWKNGARTVREIQELFPEKSRPAYTTVQTVMNRLEGKGALTRTRKLGNAHVFEATVSRNAVQRRLVDDFLALFGGRMQPLMAHLVESGRLTLDDVQDAEKKLQELAKKKGKRR
jgi:predicted transcriptional regulator